VVAIAQKRHLPHYRHLQGDCLAGEGPRPQATEVGTRHLVVEGGIEHDSGPLANRRGLRQGGQAAHEDQSAAVAVGFGFRKSTTIFPGFRLNFSKRGVGVSGGRRGASVSRSAQGRKQVSLGWKGMFWRRKV
jgi:Protein of unknown function (DUF4236)